MLDAALSAKCHSGKPKFFTALPKGSGLAFWMGDFASHRAAPVEQGSGMKRTTTRLKELLARRTATPMPGAANAMFARVIEDLGFEAVYVTGAGIANMYLGVPDIGLTTLTEIADHIAPIADAIEIPMVVDADTGFGNALNMMRTVKVMERAGAAGIQIEDQVFPKKCGHFAGKDVIAIDEMVQKVKAAVDARKDQDFQIVARTDSRAVLGIDAAIERAQLLIEAGADATFVEAPLNEQELARIARELKIPQFANIVFGGRTPDPAMGFGAVLYANAALQASIRATQDVLGALQRDGSLAAVGDRLAGFAERQRTVKKDDYDALEQRYRVGAATPGLAARTVKE
jgi:2-methylisocitrate lyase-like PEP mutase family enzyme